MPSPDVPAEPETSGPTRSPGNGWQKAAKRYAPFVVVAVVIAAAVAVFGRGDDGGEEGSEASATDLDRTELISRGPMTPEKAELEGRTDVDFGPNCDTETGTLKLPTVYSPPCVAPFEGDNGGATYQGVTEDSVKIVAYVADPALDPLGAAMVSGLGANLEVEASIATIQDYVDLYSQVFETYGRTIDLEIYTGTGAGDDREAARADAIAIAEMEPFAVVGSPLQAREVFAEELTARDVMCAPGCALAFSDSFIAEREPLVWNFGPTANQASQLAAEAVGRLAGPGPAEFAGDEATRSRDRVYAVVHYDTIEGDQVEAFEELEAALGEQGIELAVDIPFQLDFARLQDNARAMIAQLEEAGVTTVIFYGDPLTPGALTKEATAQDYHPEWILGPNLLADTAVFARSFDQEQWSHGFGIALSSTPGVETIGDSYLVYTWAYGQEPPSNIYAVIDPGLRVLFYALHLAGPQLTPETFRDGLMRLPPRGGGPTRQLSSYGNDELWPEFDYGSADDASIIWWDPEARGLDELGQEDNGMYRFANGGERYTLGEFPASIEEAGLFDNDSSVIELTELPPEDRPPDYPPPDL